MDQHGTWYGGKPGDVVRSQLPPKRGTTLPHFSVHVYCGQTAGWMKTPLGTEVDLGRGHIALDGDPAPRERGTTAPLFSAHVYCGHGCLSQPATAELLFTVIRSVRGEPSLELYIG